MSKDILSLEEVAKKINERPEDIGKFKRLTRDNGYYISNFRHGRGFVLEDSKIKLKLTFKGTNQPNSFGHFKSKKGYNAKYRCTREFGNHIGEYISSIILKQLGKKACKVDLGYTTITNPYSGKEIEIEGCLSHSQLREHEMMIPACVVIEDFKSLYPKKYRTLTERGRTDSEKNYTNVDIILAAFQNKYKKSGQATSIPKMRKAFFDMCAYDIMFANRDRHDENFGLRVNQETGELSFYHLFDDEQILGMQECVTDVERYIKSDKEYQRFKEEQLTSCIGIPGQTQQIKSIELLKYLLQKYPKEILESIEDIDRYKESDLDELFGRVEKMSEAHKALAKKIFRDRRKEVREVVSEFQNTQRNTKKTTRDDDDDEVSL